MKNIIKEFEKYLLDNTGISSKSLKFYRSDISHFKAWLILKIRSLGILVEDLVETIPFLNKNLAEEYKRFLFSNNIPLKTINRRLSTLRHLSRFLLESQIIGNDFMEGLCNIKKDDSLMAEEHLVKQFSRFLDSEKVSQNTSKNYIADIKQFFNWIKDKPQTVLENQS